MPLKILKGNVHVVFFKGDGSSQDKYQSKCFHTYHAPSFAGIKMKLYKGSAWATYDWGIDDYKLKPGLKYYQLYAIEDIPDIIQSYKDPGHAKKVAEAKKEAAEAAAKEKAEKEAAVAEWKTREYPVEGDYLLLITDDGKPCEDFTFVKELVSTTGDGTFIVHDMYDRAFEVKPEFERNNIPPVKYFRAIVNIEVLIDIVEKAAS